MKRFIRWLFHLYPSATMSAVVIRCRCGQPESHAGKVCPQGQREDRGIIAKGKRVHWKVLAEGKKV